MTRIPGSHLTRDERCQISLCISNGYSQSETAELVGVSQSVVSRELKRNSVAGVYDSEQAQKNYELRRSLASSVPRKIIPEVAFKIKAMLFKTDASPEQISGRLKRECSIYLSHEAIYCFIWKDKRFGGELFKHLRHRHKPYNRRSEKNAGRGFIPNRVGIEMRPAIVSLKERFGDLEFDTIVGAGHRSSIVSVVDRASKLTWLSKIFRSTAAQVSTTLKERLGALGKRALLKTTTSDNGREFSHHEEFSRELRCSHYFATPYRSWERGLNEHTNGLVRQYLPKGTDFTQVTLNDPLIFNLA
jgi:IS30 family transposase